MSLDTISDEPFHPLAIEVMTFRYMPDKHAVSLVKPANPWSDQVRLINLSPGTALNLLAWLERHRQELEALASTEKPI